MKGAVFSAIATLFLFLSVVSFASAKGKDFAWCPCFYSSLPKEQAERLWEIREKFRAESEFLRKQIFLKRLELRKLYADPNATDEEIRAKEKELRALKDKLSDLTLERKLQERKIIAPYQLPYFRAPRRAW